MSIDAKTGAVHPRHKALLDGTPYRGRSVMDRGAKAAKKATTLKKTTQATKKKSSHTEEKK